MMTCEDGGRREDREKEKNPDSTESKETLSLS